MTEQPEKSICEQCQQENCQCRAVLSKENKPEQPTKSSSEVKRISNPVIRPETGVKNRKGVSRPFEQSKGSVL